MEPSRSSPEWTAIRPMSRSRMSAAGFPRGRSLGCSTSPSAASLLGRLGSRARLDSAWPSPAASSRPTTERSPFGTQALAAGSRCDSPCPLPPARRLGPGPPRAYLFHALIVGDPPELVQDLHQVGLVGHHLIDVLV